MQGGFAIKRIMLIEQPSMWLRWLYPHALWRMDKHEKKVYLTFDDGPIPEATPFILQCLRERGIKATFFVVGDNIRKHPDIFQMVVNDGHTIGNHTFNHMGGARHTIKTYQDNIRKCDEILGEKARLVRPPHGWMRLTQYAWLSRKYKIVMWDLVTRDYSKYLSADDVVNNIRRYTRNGSIITFHDSLKSIDKLQTALPESLDWLIRQGYSFGTL